MYNCVTYQFQELGKQRLPDDEEDNIFDCITTELGCRLVAESCIRKELSDIKENKSDSHQLDGYDAVGQNTLVPSATMSSNVLVTKSTTGSAKENNWFDFTEQNTSANEVTNCTVTTRPSSSTTVITSEHSICNVIAESKQCDSTFIPVITTKQNTTTVSEQIGLTSTHTSILPTSFVDKSHITVTPASERFMHLAKQSETEIAKITADHLKAFSRVGNDSLKDDSDTASEPMNTPDEVTDGKQSSAMSCISEYTGTSDEGQKCGHTDLQKVESNTFFSDIDTEELCVSNCDIEVEFYKSMELALIAVLKKRVGESVSQILATSVMELFKKELSCKMQKVMMKALSSVLDNVTEWTKQDQASECRVTAGATRITRLVQEWKEELMLVTKGQVEREKEIATVLSKAQTQSNWKENNNNDCNNRNSIDDVSNDYNNVTEGKNALVGSVQDVMQSQDITDCKMMGIPRNVSDQVTQTVSTGCILYLKCFHD
jgi:hypothetical protein